MHIQRPYFVLDACAQYLTSPIAPQLLAAACGKDIPIIVCLREPVTTLSFPPLYRPECGSRDRNFFPRYGYTHHVDGSVSTVCIPRPVSISRAMCFNVLTWCMDYTLLYLPVTPSRHVALPLLLLLPLPLSLPLPLPLPLPGLCRRTCRGGGLSTARWVGGMEWGCRLPVKGFLQRGFVYSYPSSSSYQTNILHPSASIP